MVKHINIPASNVSEIHISIRSNKKKVAKTSTKPKKQSSPKVVTPKVESSKQKVKTSVKVASSKPKAKMSFYQKNKKNIKRGVIGATGVATAATLLYLLKKRKMAKSNQLPVSPYDIEMEELSSPPRDQDNSKPVLSLKEPRVIPAPKEPKEPKERKEPVQLIDINAMDNVFMKIIKKELSNKSNTLQGVRGKSFKVGNGSCDDYKNFLDFIEKDCKYTFGTKTDYWKRCMSHKFNDYGINRTRVEEAAKQLNC